MSRASWAAVALVLCACSGSGGTRSESAATEPPPPDTAPPPSVPSPVSVVPDGTPAAAYVGRFDTRDPAGPKCGWPGCRVVVRFEGTEAAARLVDELTEGQPGPSEWDVSVDGAPPSTIVVDTHPREYLIASELPQGTHTVELYKRSEAQVGVTQILGFAFGAGHMLAPPPPKSRRVEIIGDSAAAGFGVEGRAPTCLPLDWAARWENFHVSFGARLGEILDADVHGTVYSGKGLVKNIWRADPDVMPRLFPRANPNDPSSVFDLTSWVPDVIVVMIGGNDFDVGLPQDDGPATLDAFTSAYAAFVDQLRAVYKSSWILLEVSPSLRDTMPAGRSSRTNVTNAIAAVIATRNAKGDARVSTAELGEGTDAELVACDGHGTAALHDRVARELTGPIREKTGW